MYHRKVNIRHCRTGYVIDKENLSLGWKYGSGFITADMIKQHLYAPSNETLTLICGPPPMIEFACNPNLDKLGYAADRRHAY